MPQYITQLDPNQITSGDNEFNEYEINTSEQIKDFQEGYKMQNKDNYESNNNNRKENKKEIIKENVESNGNAINDLDKELLQNQTIKELEKYNNELKDKCDQLEESNEKEIKNSKELAQKVKDLENQLNEEKKKNQNLEEKNQNLEKELENAKKNQNSQKIENLVTEEKKEQFVQSIIEKDNEIRMLKSKLEQIEKETISVIFMDEEQKIHYSLVVKLSEKLNTIEDRLMEKFSELEDDYDFYFKEKKLNKRKNYKDNDLDNGSIIILKKRN